MTTLGQLPGQEFVWGIPGTQVEPTVAMGDQQIFYVNSAHANADDANYGTAPDAPLATIQELINRSLGTGTISNPALRTYDVVYVSGTVAEDVVTGNYTQMPSYISIIGVGPSRYSPSWTGSNAALPSLDLRCVGWRISGFRFYGKTGAACVELRHTDSGADDIAIRTQIDNCYFDGLTTGLAGIVTHGCYDVWVKDCTFSLFHNGGGTATAFLAGTTPLAIPYHQHVEGCHFYDNDNHYDCPSNGSFVRGCTFQKVGYAYTTTVTLRTSLPGNPGDDNVISGNVLTGDYSNVGGYVAGAADIWIGNFADDVAEAEVSDTGITILPPT